MGRNNLVKSKTLYNIKERHKVTKDSVIYENDLVTILPGRGESDYDSVVYPNSIFQYRIKSNKNSKKKHHRGEFIKPSVQIENESEYVWSLENLGSGVTLSSESKIIHKPNYSSLKDFAYYGSAVELIKATVNDVIMRFPGGLSYYNENPPIINVCGVDYYEISNEFEIDCWTTGVIPYENIKNPMRVLAASYDKYVLDNGAQCSSPKFTPNKSTSYNSIIGTTNFGAGDFSVYLDANGKHKLLTTQKGQGVILKPKQEYIDKFWDEVDDFERVLLNRDTSPVYKAVFETPFITENGHFYTNKSYIWPTINNDGITPDLSTDAFNGYLQSLLTLATYHDKYDSDNLWRMMTHESIKHLDWTFTDKNNQESEEDFESSGMEAMIRIYGRQFDDIKRYADGIKSMNVLSYDGKNNVPDYFLSDKVEEDGWLAKHVSRFENILTDSIMEILNRTVDDNNVIKIKDSSSISLLAISIFSLFNKVIYF
jgi:hypothetical protein